jgi:hypothetical protein
MTDTFVPDLQGEHYLNVLANLHKFVKPKRYLEIGTRHGDSLGLSQCDSIAIDPGFELRGDFLGQKEKCLLFKMTSDDFFRQNDPKFLLDGPIDLAFLDGLHLFEVLLRDFFHLEAASSRNSAIVMHDCIPTDAYMCARSEGDFETRNKGRHPEWWTGDVWKIVPILQKYRPDLRIYNFDSSPTGLVVVTNLEPSSTVLSENYFKIVEEFTETNLFDIGVTTFLSNLKLRSTINITTLEEVSRIFWL